MSAYIDYLNGHRIQYNMRYEFCFPPFHLFTFPSFQVINVIIVLSLQTWESPNFKRWSAWSIVYYLIIIGGWAVGKTICSHVLRDAQGRDFRFSGVTPSPQIGKAQNSCMRLLSRAAWGGDSKSGRLISLLG